MCGRFDGAGSDRDSPVPGNDETRRHRLLADARRRRVIEVLDARQGPLTLAEVVESVAEREAADENGDDLGHLTTALHHVHLPLLAASGVCDYDPVTQTVEVDGEAVAALASD